MHGKDLPLLCLGGVRGGRIEYNKSHKKDQV
jgi:hypothetical protein